MSRSVSLLLILSVLTMFMVRARGNDSRIVEAREKLKELQEELAAQEKLVQMLKDQVPQCSPDDRECKSDARRQDRKYKNRLGGFADDPYEDGLKLTMQTQLKLKGKATMLRWLPFFTMDAHSAITRLMVAVDSKGFLHVLDNAAHVLSSWPCGHASSVTSLAVSPPLGNVCYIATGSKHGEVRVHSFPVPPKFEISPASSRIALKQARKIGRNGWKPVLSHVHDFFPTRTQRIDKISDRSFEVSNTSAPAEITSMQFVQKGRSLNLVAGDAAGRMFWMLLNGSLVSSRHIDQSLQPAVDVKIEDIAALPDTHWILAGWSGGLSAMDIRQASMQQVQCVKFVIDKQGKSRGEKKPETRLVDFEVASMALDAEIKRSRFHLMYVGTKAGQTLVLQIRRDFDPKTNSAQVKCRILQEINIVDETSGKHVPVHVALMKDYLAAAASGSSITSLSIYNISRIPANFRSLPPLVQYIPLKSVGQTSLQVAGMESSVLVMGGQKDLWLYDMRSAEFNSPPHEWDISLLENIRQPLLVVGMLVVFYWQFRKKQKKGGKDRRDATMRRLEEMGLTGKGRDVRFRNTGERRKPTRMFDIDE